MGRWGRYWFDDGGRTALAIVRVAVAVSVLLTLARLDHSFSTGNVPDAPSLYRPIGIWMLLGDTPPPGALVDVLWALAWAGTVAMLLGATTRVSTAISFVTAVALASLSFSASRTWSHQYNVVFLAQMALLGARSGDVFSIDWLVRRQRGLPAHDVPRGYQWSLRLVQLAVALMFASAVFHKLLHSQFTLRWALSDNLRHHLLMRYDLAGLERPPLVEWLLDDPWRYRTTAVLNMISQAVPLLAVLFVRRPWLRAVAGLFFVTETVALGLVVNLWNLHWLPLAAVFVDWDRLIARITRRTYSWPAPRTPWRPPRAARVFIVVFCLYELLTSLVPTLDQRLNTYPFSGFPMFAKLRARPPYDQHQPYGVAGDRFEVTTMDRPMDLPTQRWFDHRNRGIHEVRDRGELERRLRAVLRHSQKRYWDYGVTSFRHWLALYVAPAYPERARFDRYPIAITGELLADGTFHTYLGKLRGTPGAPGAVLELPARPGGWSGARVVYYRDDEPNAIEVAAPITGNTVDLSGSIAGHPLYFVVVVEDTPWLVASYAPWRW